MSCLLTRREFLRLLVRAPLAAGAVSVHPAAAATATQEAPMSAGRHDLVIEQGADLIWPLRFEDDAGTLLDLTGFTARMKVRASYDATTALLTLTTENGHITVFDDSGTHNLELDITNAQSAALTDWGRGFWDLELVDTFGRVARVLQGFAYLSREATY